MRNKKGIGLITLIIIIAVILVIGGVILFSVINKKPMNEGTGDTVNNNSSHNQNPNIQENNTTALNQEYFNKNYSSKDKLSIVFTKDYMNGPNVFVGIELDGIAEDLSYDIDNYGKLGNNRSNFRTIGGGDSVEIQYDNTKITIGNNTQLKYKNDASGQYIGKYKIIKNQNNYFIAENTDYNYYILFLKYNETTYNGEVYWQMLSLANEENLDNITKTINYIDEHFSVCTYEDDINKCNSINNKAVNYKEYRYYADMILDYLNENNLYVASYKQVSIYTNQIKVTNNSAISKAGTASFSIKEAKTYGRNAEQKFSMNNKEFYISDHFIGMTKDNSVLNVTVTLTQGVEYTADNCIKEFKNTFKK